MIVHEFFSQLDESKRAEKLLELAIPNLFRLGVRQRGRHLNLS
jgi:hypothetical protein